ncbi:MAG: GNAT family N-acetyltransferase [Granulosicoccus sp.]
MNSQLHIEVRDSLADVPAEQWNALSQDGNPFLRHEFLHTLDTTGCLGERTGWYPRYFFLWQGDKDKRELIGAVPAYVKTNSYGEFVFDWAWAEAYERHQMDYYPKLVCSIPFTPATGRRLLTRADQPFEETVRLLAAGVRQFVQNEKLSSGHFLFLTEAESKVLSDSSLHVQTESPGQQQDQNDPADPNQNTSEKANFEENNTEETHSEDISEENLKADFLRRMDCQYHWHNDNYTSFEDFLARCTAKRRKTIRRERRYVTDAALRLEPRMGSTLSEKEWRWVHQFYTSTFDRKWGNPSLTRAFFEQIGEQLGDHVLIVFAYDPDDETPDWPVACSIMFVGTNTLYGRFWGCRAEYNALHFEACYYQGIEYCIANGIDHFEPGAQGEHKITRGFVPTLTRSAHYIRHPQFRSAIENFLSQETPYVQQRCKGLSDLLPFKQQNLSV